MTDPTSTLDAGAAPDAPPSGLLQSLREQHTALLADHQLAKRLPGFDGLVVVYRTLSRDEMRVIGKRAMREAKMSAQLSGAANATIEQLDTVELVTAQDCLIAACVGLFNHDPEHADADDRGLVPLQSYPELGLEADLPIRFEIRLADLLGYQADTAREVLLGLFGASPYAPLMSQFGAWREWTQDVTDEALQDFPKGS